MALTRQASVMSKGGNMFKKSIILAIVIEKGQPLVIPAK